MKKTNRITNLISILMFFAAVVYIGLYLRQSDSSYATAEVIDMTIEETATASGIVVRNETLVTNPLNYCYISAEDGAHISRGGLLGTAPIMPVREYSPAKFIHRGGRVPAPSHSLKN